MKRVRRLLRKASTQQELPKCHKCSGIFVGPRFGSTFRCERKKSPGITNLPQFQERLSK